MRLTKKYLKTVNVYRCTETVSAYIGTEITLNFVESIEANVQSAENKLNAEIYGERITDMITLYCELSADVLNGDIIEIDEIQYRIVSLKPYNTHKVLMGAKT